jgi:DNA-binding Lrp family transcriptional regulator
LPRGRVRQDPYEAKDDSIRRILTALELNPEGLRFKELKKITKLHQDTLSVRLEELVDDEVVKHPGKLYKISPRGEDDLSRRELINHIESAGFVVVGGPDDISPYTDEEIIMKSTVGYAFPAISPSVVGALRRVLHKYWVLHLVTSLAANGKIDPRCLTGERPLENMLNDLKSAMTETKLVLGFMIDKRELKQRLNIEYMQEIVRLAKVEDNNHVEIKDPEYMKAFRRYAKVRNTAE